MQAGSYIMRSVFTCIVWNWRVLLLLCVWEALDSESMNGVFYRFLAGMVFARRVLLAGEIVR